MADISNSRGSVWHRWDPHIHIPGTLHNDQFGGDDEGCIEKINSASPAIRVLGITDYYVLDSYRKALDWQEQGRLPGIAFIFPNIELRFAVNAPKGSAINVHLLISPEDDDHIQQSEKFLGELTFKYSGEKFRCRKSDLIGLGRAYNADAKDDKHALKIGAEQFKVNPDDLIRAIEESAWAKSNILVAIAASSKDGTAQLPTAGGLAATRRKLERAAHVIFSSKESDRLFWLGQSKVERTTLDAEYGGLKPCLHGCDSHKVDQVGNPSLQRYCWIKGDLTFDSLRQATIEPADRAYVGQEPPKGGTPSNTIVGVGISDADWLATPDVPINAGLVAIIGARGSGKTALVESIAAGANSIDKSQAKGSFLDRAEALISTEVSTVTWGGGGPTSSSIDISKMPDEPEAPRVRYLSQQFVDRLCSSDGLADELVSEIERVIFQAHPPDTRYNASSFSELRETMTASIRRAKERFKAVLVEIAQELSIQRDLHRSVAQLNRTRSELTATIARDKADRKKIAPSDNKPLLDLLDAVRSAAEGISQDIATLSKQHLDLTGLKQEIKQFRDFDADTRLQALRNDYPNAGLSDEDWRQFRLSFDDEIDALIDEKTKAVTLIMNEKKGPAKGEAEEFEERAKAAPYLSAKDDLSKQTLSLLLKEQRRLEAVLGVDTEKRKRYRKLSEKIVKAEAQLKKLDAEITKAEAAEGKIKELLVRREDTYRRIFGEIVKEEEVLQQLYDPLEEGLESQEGALKKLTFSVRREVDLESWAESGESNLDVRKQGEFRGKGSLREIVGEYLYEAWQSGNPTEVAESLSSFRERYSAEFWNHAPEYAVQTRETKRTWFDKVSAWLYSTEHIQITYGLQYEGVEIQRLSPGTRGIVLLLLYLSVDREDDRPLVIDQPEENLDPKSIYDELVSRFKETKSRRQVIIVTHNANLVVNTDADQVIVASRGAHREGKLPVLSYRSGGLENPGIRQSVCEILEGGEAAFRERARRLRVTLPSD